MTGGEGPDHADAGTMMEKKLHASVANRGLVELPDYYVWLTVELVEWNNAIVVQNIRCGGFGLGWMSRAE